MERIRDGEIGDIIALRAYRMGRRRRRRRPQADGYQRAALPDAAVPRLSLGQRRRLQRFLHPPDRRVLLDEGRLAGSGPGHRADATSAAIRSTRTSTPTRSSTPSPTAPSCSTTAATSPAATTSSPATPTAPRARRLSPPPAITPGKVRIFTGTELTKQDQIWAFPQPEQSPYHLEWEDLIAAIRRTSPTTK